MCEGKTRREVMSRSIFAVFHPQGGRKVVNLDTDSESDLRILKNSGWKESPLEFWDAEKVAAKVAEGFFNDEHEWERVNADITSNADGDGRVEDSKAADSARGEEVEAVPLHGEEDDNRDRKELDGQGAERSGDQLPVSERPSGVPSGLEKVSALDDKAKRGKKGSSDGHAVQPRARRSTGVQDDAGKHKGR